MPIARSLSLAALLLAPAFAQAPAKPKHLLRFNFQAGQTVSQVMTQEVTMKMNMGAEDLVTKTTTNTYTTYKVRSVEGDTASFENTMTRVTAMMDSPMEKVDYDSDKDESRPGSLEALAEMVGETVTLKMSDRGAVSEVVLPDSIKELNGIDFEQMMSQIVHQMPDHPVAVGESWSVDQDIPMGQMGDADAVLTYKLIRVTDAEYVFDQALKLDAASMKLPPQMELQDIQASGKVTISRSCGMPTSMSMTMTMLVDGPLKIEMTMKQELKPAAATKKAPVTGPGKDDKQKGPGESGAP